MQIEGKKALVRDHYFLYFRLVQLNPRSNVLVRVKHVSPCYVSDFSPAISDGEVMHCLMTWDHIIISLLACLLRAQRLLTYLASRPNRMQKAKMKYRIRQRKKIVTELKEETMWHPEKKEEGKTRNKQTPKMICPHGSIRFHGLL